MAAHKPVEWVQAVITRFDEQVRWVDSVDGCSKLWQSVGPTTVANIYTEEVLLVITMYGSV